MKKSLLVVALVSFVCYGTNYAEVLHIDKEESLAIGKALPFLDKNLVRFLQTEPEKSKEAYIVALTGLAFLSSGNSARYSDQVAKITDYLKKYVEANHKSPRIQCTWNLAFVSLYFAELHSREQQKESGQKAQIENTIRKIIQILLKKQTGDGGWGHGVHIPLKIGGKYNYPDTLISCTAWCTAAMGIFKKLSFQIPQKSIDGVVGLYKKCQLSNGAICYGFSQELVKNNVQGGKWGKGDTGRTASVLCALLCLGDENAKDVLGKAAKMLRENIPDVQNGYTTSTMHMLYAALGFRLLGTDDWKKFDKYYREKILASQDKEGWFTCICNRGMPCIDDVEHPARKVKEEGRLPARMYITAIYSAILRLRNLRLLKSLTPPESVSIEVTNSGTEKNLHSVTFVDEQTGFCVGDKGTLLRTADGGSTWHEVNIDTDANLSDISFCDKEAGWIVGTGGSAEKLPEKLADYFRNFGRGGRLTFDREVLKYLSGGHFLTADLPFPTILATTDGGATWVKKKLVRTNFTPTAVCAVDKETACFSTYSTDHGDGDLWVTRNGGHSWRLHRLWRNVYDFQMIDAQNGWAVGEVKQHLNRGTEGGIYHTSNGKKWEVLEKDFALKEAVMAVHFISKEQGWMVTEQGSIYHTADAGETFTRQFGPDSPDSGSGKRIKGHVYAKKIKFPYEVIRFGDSLHGLAGGCGGVLFTTDGGREWKKARLPAEAHIRDIAFLNPATAFAVADNGVMLKIRFH